MDVISRLVRSGDIRPLKLSVLLNSLEFLSQHCNSNHITVDDVKESVSFHILSGVEFDLYVSLIVESLLMPYLYVDGSIRMKLRQLNGDEVLFLNDVYKVMASHNQANTFNNINSILQVFNENINSYALERSKLNFRVKWAATKGATTTSFVAGSNGESNSGDDSSVTLVKKYSQILASSNNTTSNKITSSTTCTSPNSTISGQGKSYFNRKALSLERNEYIIRFLARVRKQGMDILFPQSTHDRVIACVYTSMVLLKSPAHRELIDIVMEIKDLGTFFEASESESISKTKIRGLLALLKHSDILKTKGLEGQPVELVFNNDITSYKILRSKHDNYIIQFISENHIVLPKYLHQDIIWLESSDKKIKYIEATIDLIKSKYKDIIYSVHQKAIAELKSETTTFKNDKKTAFHPLSEPILDNESDKGNKQGGSNSKIETSNSRVDKFQDDFLFFPSSSFDMMNDSFDKSLNIIQQGFDIGHYEAYNFQPLEPPPNLSRIVNSDSKSSYSPTIPQGLSKLNPQQQLITSQLDYLSLDNSYHDTYLEGNIFTTASCNETINSTINYESVFSRQSSVEGSKLFKSQIVPPPQSLSIEVFDSLQNFTNSTSSRTQQKYIYSSPTHSTTSDSSSTSEITDSTKSASSSSLSTPYYDDPTSLYFERFFGGQDPYSLTPNKNTSIVKDDQNDDLITLVNAVTSTTDAENNNDDKDNI